MKKLNIYWILLMSIIISFGSCEKFLEEDNYSNITGDSYITEETAGELVVAVYKELREIYKRYDAMQMGTDMYTDKGPLTSFNPLNDYKDFTTDIGEIGSVWNDNYKLISRANSAIERLSQMDFKETNLQMKKTSIAESKTLRSLAYFQLVQQFGGVPLVLKEIKTIEFDYTRATEEEVFNQIISDLEDAIPDLEEAPEFGRISQKAAKHLLAQVYLTRGYLSFGSGVADFNKAAVLAEEVIGTYDLLSLEFAEVFDYNNQQNAEILFSIQYHNTSNSGDQSNNKHTIVKNTIDNYIGLNRASQYATPGGGGMPTNYFYSLFDTTDKREDVTLVRVLYANVEAYHVRGTDTLEMVNPGDTVVYYPKNVLSDAEIAARNYWVYNPGQYYYNTGLTDVTGAMYKYSENVNKENFPIFGKFLDPNDESTENNKGTRDTYVFRYAGTHLLASEAYLKAGNTAKALEHINIVRERATDIQNHYTTLTIDDILDERALELAGEENRWNVLKRAGKLEERIKLYNPHVSDHGDFKAHHLLRPIPQLEVEKSNGAIKQNPGYN